MALDERALDEEAQYGGAPGARRVEERLARRGGAVELLRLPAAAFGVAARLRRAAYDLGLAPVVRLPVPVVSIGNLTAGGTGKTPASAWVVRELQARGFRPGLLSRGYGAPRADPGAPGGEGGLPAANDEALVLARLAPGVPNVQDPDRRRGGARLVARGADLIVLDDGFQHRRLARDLDLVLVDATRPWGLPAIDKQPAVRALLPRGLLREPPSSLARADALLITRSDQAETGALARLEAELAALAPGRPLARAVHAPRAWRAADGRERPLSELAGREVDLVSAIGNPEAFERSVAQLGLRVCERRRFPDHHRYVREDLSGLGQGRPLVATEKDAVKLEPLGVACWALAIEFRLVAGLAPIAALLDGLPREVRPG